MFSQPEAAEHWSGRLGPPEPQPHVSVWDSDYEAERAEIFG
jgi:hypothetical protein